MTSHNPKSPLAYIFRELSIKTHDWKQLSDKDKTDLKEMAVKEMAVLRGEQDEED